MNTDKMQAWFDMMSRNRFVVLDTETTGLAYPAEIIQIAILDFMGDEILDTLVKPRHRIPIEATRIHGITDDMVADAPTWANVREQVYEIIKTKDVIIYNADYDVAMLHDTDMVHEFSDIGWINIASYHCAMRWYAEYFGEWNDYRQSYRWQKLEAACRQQKIPFADAHMAIADCKATYALITKIRADEARKSIR